MRKLFKFLFVDETKLDNGKSVKGSIDTPQNMLTLEPSLHTLWGEGHVAFEPYQQLDNGVVLKFRWLRKRQAPKTKDLYSPRQSMDLTTHPDSVLPDQNTHKMPHFETYRPILDGQEVVITSDNNALHPNWDVLQLAWDLCCMTSLAAAADVVPEWELDFDLFDDDSDLEYDNDSDLQCDDDDTATLLNRPAKQPRS